MFAAADRFMVPGLLALVREKIKKRLLTSNLDCQLAIAQCVYDAEDITPASGGGSLRQLIGPIVFASVRKVMQEAQLAAKLEATPALAVDMIRHFCANKNPWPDVKKYLCPRCDKRFVAVIPDHTTCRCLHCGFSRLYWDSYAVPLE
jgi:DNA-directed RNA polymerase subunit RPC12/RpoP